MYIYRSARNKPPSGIKKSRKKNIFPKRLLFLFLFFFFFVVVGVKKKKILPSFGAHKLRPTEEPKKTRPKQLDMWDSRYGDPKTKGWASGTGYGHAGNTTEWDMEAYLAAQKKKVFFF